MPNKDIFCNIPWYELHINHDGSYDLCGCMTSTITDTDDGKKWNIQNYPIEQYWQSRRLRDARLSKLSDIPDPACGVCQHQDRIGNHSKRIKENLKSVVFYDRNFYKSFDQSPHKEIFDHSLNNDGATTTVPVSYHLSLGNECDLACVMCGPTNSFKLAQDYKTLGWIKESKRLNWTDDQEVWDRFCKTLMNTKLVNLHIIGGEPTINKKFFELIDMFVSAGNTDFSFSFTTNCMHRIDHLWDKLSKFKRVEIGMSIETVSASNNYVRYGSDINTILDNIQHFKQTAPANVDFVIRSVPTLLTITEYDKLIDWCYDNNFLLNSYFAVNPAWHQIKLLPTEIKDTLRNVFEQQLARYQLLAKDRHAALTNFRNKTYVVENLIKEIGAAINSLETGTDAQLVKIAKQKFQQLDQLRNLNVVDSFPMLKGFFNE